MEIPKSNDPRRIDIEGRVLVAHQAEFMPWLGFISKAAMGDIYLILDDTQFKKKYFENRNKIRIFNGKGWTWLTIPVASEDSYPNMLDVKCKDKRWIDKHLKTFKTAYARAPYFDQIFPEIKEIYETIETDNLVDINIEFIKYAFKKFKVNIPIYRVSELKDFRYQIEGFGEDLVLNMTKAVKAQIYVAGQSGINYLNPERFTYHGIDLVFQDFKHPKYNQIHGEFLSYMSFVDLLFNYGDESINILPKSEYKR